MKKIRKYMILGLIAVFAAFFIFPASLFASGVDQATITQIVPGECGEETEACFSIDWFGSGSYGWDNLYAKLKLIELPGGCPGIVWEGAVGNDESKCVLIGVIPKGDYLLTLEIYPFEGTTPHNEAYDEEAFTIGDCKTSIIGVEKVDGKGDPLTGAGFTLYNADKSKVEVAEKMVDAAGKVAFNNLKLGTYVVSETTVPSGFKGMADKTVTINAGNAGKVLNVVFENTKETPPEEPPEDVEVEGLTEEGDVEVLAYTGPDPLLYVLGFLFFTIAGLIIFRIRAAKVKK